MFNERTHLAEVVRPLRITFLVSDVDVDGTQLLQWMNAWYEFFTQLIVHNEKNSILSGYRSNVRFAFLDRFEDSDVVDVVTKSMLRFDVFLRVCDQRVEPEERINLAIVVPGILWPSIGDFDRRESNDGKSRRDQASGVVDRQACATTLTREPFQLSSWNWNERRQRTKHCAWRLETSDV